MQNWKKTFFPELSVGMQNWNAELGVGFNGKRFTHRNWDMFFYIQRPTVYASPKERICGHAIGSFWSRRPSRSWRSFRGLHISRRVTSCVLACVSWNLWSRIYIYILYDFVFLVINESRTKIEPQGCLGCVAILFRSHIGKEKGNSFTDSDGWFG